MCILKIFLTAALHDPVMFLLSQDELYLDTDPSKCAIRFPPEERKRRFGEEGSEKYIKNVDAYRKVIIGKLVTISIKFIDGRLLAYFLRSLTIVAVLSLEAVLKFGCWYCSLDRLNTMKGGKFSFWSRNALCRNTPSDAVLSDESGVADASASRGVVGGGPRVEGGSIADLHRPDLHLLYLSRDRQSRAVGHNRGHAD